MVAMPPLNPIVTQDFSFYLSFMDSRFQERKNRNLAVAATRESELLS